LCVRIVLCQEKKGIKGKRPKGKGGRKALQNERQKEKGTKESCRGGRAKDPSLSGMGGGR